MFLCDKEPPMSIEQERLSEKRLDKTQGRENRKEAIAVVQRR